MLQEKTFTPPIYSLTWLIGQECCCAISTPVPRTLKYKLGFLDKKLVKDNQAK